MDKPRLGERLHYGFDSWMARGTAAIMGLLGLATVVFVLVVALIAVLLRVFPDDAEDGDFWDIVWGNLMRTLDPGTMGGDTGWGFRLLMLLVTVGGLIIVASLIGIVSGAFDDKMVELRKGRSLVLETGHTVILGWSPQLFRIISETCIANESRGRSAIVVLADLDKVEMEEELRARVPDPGRTRIVCRRGDPTSPSDLRIANPQAARSIVVLTSGAADPDAAAIKIVLALNRTLPDSAAPAIVAELREPENLAAARLVGRDRTRWLLAGDLIRRMTAQTCRQGGLSVVYSELLDFSGGEFYVTWQPQLAGSTYLEAQFAFQDSTVVGITQGAEVLLNPPADTELAAGTRLVVISADDSLVRATDPGVADEAVLAQVVAAPRRPERTLVLGYNDGVAPMLRELAQYVPTGSSAAIVTSGEVPEIKVPEGFSVVARRADPTNRGVLEAFYTAGYDHVLVLADHNLEPQAADARTLVTLLHLRDIADRHRERLNIVSEMLDDRNRELAEVTEADDFIVSDRLVGLLLSQLSENPQLADVFETLFSAAGSEIYLRPAGLYITPGAEADFYSVLAAAAARGETAIGYRLATDAHSGERGYGVHLNPHKPDRLRFTEHDMVIVLAEDEH